MNKITLLIFILSAYLCTAQTIYFKDDFNDEDLSDWTSYDVDVDGYDWMSYSPLGNGYMSSASWVYPDNVSTPLYPNNFIISPPINLSSASGSIYLNWIAGGQDADYPYENYSVYVGTSANIDDLTGDGVVSFTENIGDDPAGRGGFAYRSLDITSLAGEATVYVAFRHHDVSDQFILNIDNVEVSSASSAAGTSESCDTAMTVYTGTYTVDLIDSYYKPITDCEGGDLAYGSAWYTFTAETAGNITISTNLSQNEDGDTRINVYSGTCESFTCVAANDDTAQSYFSEVTFATTTGTTYYLVFDNIWTSLGFDFEISGEGLGIANNTGLDFIKYYNSAKDALFLKANFNLEQIELYTLLGQKIGAQKLQGQESEIDMSSLSTGIYIASVKIGDKTETFKISKQ